MILQRTKFLLKQFASPVLDRLGLYDPRLSRLLRDPWTIVMYHRVIDDAALDPFSLGMCVRRKHFVEQLAYFKRNFSPISMSEAMARRARGQPLPERALSITFDDAYLDNLTLALPLLQAHQLEATLYVPTGGFDDGQPLWWDRVIRALDATTESMLHPSELGLPLQEGSLSLSAWHRDATALKVLNSLWGLPIGEVLRVVDRIERALPPRRHAAPVAQRMNAQQVLAMHRAGIELGAHSVHHPNLTLETPEKIRDEVQTSKRVLENLCGEPVQGFAYPAGWKNAAAVQAVKEAGFSYAVATRSGVNGPHADPLDLSRIGMPDTSVSDFKRALVSVIQRSSQAHGTR